MSIRRSGVDMEILLTHSTVARLEMGNGRMVAEKKMEGRSFRRRFKSQTPTVAALALKSVTT
jgi:hypothetical protein